MVSSPHGVQTDEVALGVVHQSNVAVFAYGHFRAKQATAGVHRALRFDRAILARKVHQRTAASGAQGTDQQQTPTNRSNQKGSKKSKKKK